MPAPLPRRKLGLPRGLRLLEYRIERVLGQGGFGITYLATDEHLDAKVAIKEYLPEDIVFRASDRSVWPNASQHRDRYRQGLENFLVEARTLASFRHPNIVRVARFFEAHATAYMVLEYERGQSFKTWWLAQGQRGQALLIERLQPLLHGLSVVHAAGYLHRDIKPDNIQVRKEDGRFVLLDFGSAGQTVALADQDAVVVTPGYAPIEQYGMGGQGAWTDIYALGATLYWAVAGRKPPDAESRASGTPMAPAAEVGRGRFGPSFLAAIDWALEVDAAARPRHVHEWRDRLLADQVSNASQDAMEDLDSVLDASDDPQRRVGRAAPWRSGLRRLRSPGGWPLAAQLGIPLLLLAVLPSLVAIVWALPDAQDAMVQAQRPRLERLARDTASALGRRLADGARMARAMATGARLAGWPTRPDVSTPQTLLEQLEGLRDGPPDATSWMLLDGRGVTRLATDATRIGQPLGLREDVRAALAGQSYAGGLQPGMLSDAEPLRYAEPVRDPNGQVVGVLALALQPGAVDEVLARVTQPDGPPPWLIDARGDFVRQPQPDRRPRPADQPALWAAIQAAPQGGSLVYQPATGAQVEIAAFSAVPGTPWTLGLSEPAEAAWAPLKAARDGLPWLLLLTTVAAAALLLRVVHGIVKPVRSVAAGAQALKAGAFDKAYVDVSGRDEVGQLGRTFNGLVDALRERERERASRRQS
jgi:serine/threonine protein kinase/HAMP domain-containing protein